MRPVCLYNFPFFRCCFFLRIGKLIEVTNHTKNAEIIEKEKCIIGKKRKKSNMPYTKRRKIENYDVVSRGYYNKILIFVRFR